MLVRRIGEILRETNAHGADQFSMEFWQWKYATAADQRPIVYGAWDGDELVGYMHVVLYRAVAFGRPAVIATIQDVAVSETQRGKGIFRQISEYLHADLPNQGAQLMYIYPNQRAIHTYLKYNGYTYLGAYDTYLLPLRPTSVIRSRFKLPLLDSLGGGVVQAYTRLFRVRPSGTIRILDAPTEEMAALFVGYYNSLQGIHMVRDKALLSWRYGAKPGVVHRYICVEQDGKLVAATIWRLDTLLENTAALLMDAAGPTEAILTAIQYVKQQPAEALGETVNLLFASAWEMPWLPKLTRVGFVKVPERLNPRPLKLLTRNYSLPEAEQVTQPASWRVTLTDWDVF